MHKVLSLLFSLFLAAPGMAATAQPPMTIPAMPDAPGSVLAVWTQFVAGPALDQKNDAIELRFVLMGDGGCDGPVLDQTPKGQAVATARTTMSGEFHKNPNHADGTEYSVTICAARLDPATERVVLRDRSGDALPVYPDNAEASVPGPAMLGRADGTGDTIGGIAIGDSGCRGHDPTHTKSRDQQNCDATSWPLKSMADDAARLNPDFVIHVGDYHYFWELNAYWSRDQGKDRFEFWAQEFLVPAGKLLRAAPWMLARGNHEICQSDWFGDGWHALFGPDAMTPGGAHCAAPVSATWAVDLAPAADPGAAYRWVMIDSAQATNRGGFAQAALNSVLVKDGASGWVTHYPPIKMAFYHHRWNYGDGNIYNDVLGAYDPAHTGSHAAVSPCEPGKPCIPDAVISGHQHFYQAFDFGDDLPLVMIVGHGGTGVDGGGFPGGSAGPADACTRDFSRHNPFDLAQGHASATLHTVQLHGFVGLRRGKGVTVDASGWERTLYWANGRAPTFGTPTTCAHNR